MKALLCPELGSLDKLRVEELPIPAPDAGQVLVKAVAAIVNFPDLLITQGRYQAKMPLPFVPGSEAAGIVEQVGEGVTDIAPGDRIVAIPMFGAYAEWFVCDRSAVFKLPSNFPLDLAASFAVTYGTAYLGLATQGRLKPGETVLILGATGGVGLAALEIAKALGARVIAGASTAEKLAAARAAGADMLIDYVNADLKAEVREMTNGEGVDIVFDPVGDRFAEPALRTLKWEGRYLVIGFAGGEIPRLPANLLLLKSASAIGVALGERGRHDPQTLENNFRQLCAMFQDGRLKGHIHARYPLEQAAEALREIRDRKVIGKLLLEIAGLQSGEP